MTEGERSEEAPVKLTEQEQKLREYRTFITSVADRVNNIPDEISYKDFQQIPEQERPQFYQMHMIAWAIKLQKDMGREVTAESLQQTRKLYKGMGLPDGQAIPIKSNLERARTDQKERFIKGMPGSFSDRIKGLLINHVSPSSDIPSPFISLTDDIKSARLFAKSSGTGVVEVEVPAILAVNIQELSALGILSEKAIIEGGMTGGSIDAEKEFTFLLPEIPVELSTVVEYKPKIQTPLPEQQPTIVPSVEPPSKPGRFKQLFGALKGRK